MTSLDELQIISLRFRFNDIISGNVDSEKIDQNEIKMYFWKFL
jgi:hypothetical protein